MSTIEKEKYQNCVFPPQGTALSGFHHATWLLIWTIRKLLNAKDSS